MQYTNLIEIYLSSKGQNKSKLQKQRSNILISIVTVMIEISILLLCLVLLNSVIFKPCLFRLIVTKLKYPNFT